MNTPAKMETPPAPATLNDVLIRGDLSKLTEAQRTEYYLQRLPIARPQSADKTFRLSHLERQTCALRQARRRRPVAKTQRHIDRDRIARTGRGSADRPRPRQGQDRPQRRGFRSRSVQERRGRDCRKRLDESGHQGKAPRHVVNFGIWVSSMKPRWNSIAHDDDLIAEHDPPVEPRPYKITSQSWRMFGELLSKEVREAETKSDIFEWLDLNKETLAKMEKKVPKMYDTLTKAIKEIKAEPT